MLKENTFLNGSLKPVRNALSSKNLGSEPGEPPSTKMKNMKNLFYAFHIHAGLLHGSSFNFAIQIWFCFFSLKRTHSSEKRREENQFLFQLPPSTSPSPSSPDLPPSEKESTRRGGRFSLALRPLSLSNSSRPPLLCMKHRSRLKAFSGHSDTEEKRSSELY